jgi:hypothetical protein
MSLAAVLGLVLATPAWAQKPAPAAAAVAGQAGAISDAEKLKRSSEAIASMRATAGQVTSQVEAARGEQDVVKLNCVNEKLAQIKGLLKVAEQSDAALQGAVARGDPAASTEFSKIGIARSKADGLGNEARQCVGQLAYIVDEKTTVEVQQPVGQPERDTTGRYKSPTVTSPPPSAPVVLRPPPASGLQ